MITLKTNETIYIGMNRDGKAKTLSAIPAKGATFAFHPLTTEEYYEATDLISKIHKVNSVSADSETIESESIPEVKPIPVELVKAVLKFAKNKVITIHNTTKKADSFTFDTYFPLFQTLYAESTVNEEEDLFLD